MTKTANGFNIERMSSIKQLVEEIAKRQTKPVIDASIDQIADEIEKRTDSRPAKSHIWKILYELGAVASGRKFVYQHNGGKHE